MLWAGLRVAMWISHVDGKFRHGLLEKSLKIVGIDGGNRWGESKKTNKHQEFGRTPPLLDRKPSRGDFSRWSSGECPVCPADILSNQCAIAQKSGRDVLDFPGTRPHTVPGNPRHTNYQIPFCVLSLSVSSSSDVCANSHHPL